MEKFTTSNIDYENAKILLEQEKIKKLSIPEMFKACVYCILAQAERYDKQIRIYQRLLNAGIDSPESVFQKRDKLHSILRKSHYPNMKEKRIKDFSGWWVGDVLSHAILKDATNGHNDGIELRDDFAERAPSFGYKSSSLFMIKCGYEDVIPIDVWVLRFLKGEGYSVKAPDYLTVGGLTKSKYLELEKILRVMADKQGVTLAVFQGALWGKYSTWKVRREKRFF